MAYLSEPRQLLLGVSDFVLTDGVWQAWVASQRHNSAKRGEYVRRLLNPYPGNVRIGVTGSKEAVSARKVTRIVELRTQRADEPSGERDEATIPGGISRHEFRCETRTLREPDDSNLISWDSGCDRARDHFSQKAQGRIQPWLVLRYGREEGMRVPCVPRSLWSKIGKSRRVQLICEAEDVRGGGPATVNQNDRRLGRFQGLSTLQNGLIAMRIFHVHLL